MHKMILNRKIDTKRFNTKQISQFCYFAFIHIQFKTQYLQKLYSLSGNFSIQLNEQPKQPSSFLYNNLFMTTMIGRDDFSAFENDSDPCYTKTFQVSFK